jgi:hypothetical protein
MTSRRSFDAVFVNFHFKACWGVNTVRSVGVHNRLFMHGFHLDHPCAVFTSFGSPYHLRQFSGLPNYINAHSSSAHSQRAAVSAWFGDLPSPARAPSAACPRILAARPPRARRPLACAAR